MSMEPGSTARGGSFESHACEVNALSIDELFRRYERSGFLYPGKLKKLAPFLPLVKENWRKARLGGELIQWVATYENPAQNQWASITSWLSTRAGWVSQHLVSMGGPAASRAVMLAGQAVRIADRRDGSHQSWFRRNNRYANRIFGSMPETLGGQHGWVGDYAHYYLHPAPLTIANHVRVEAATAADLAELRAFIAKTRSNVFLSAEGLLEDDLALDSVDQIYARVGLRRYRRVVAVRAISDSALLGVALAYRGPLGLNFSFLENRCDLILSSQLSIAQAVVVCSALCAGAASLYADFELGVIPLVIDARHSGALQALGAEYLRDYAQCAWLQPGYADCYRHTERFYARLMKAGSRRGLGRPPRLCASSAPC
jgi:hypothetical protein